MNWPPLIVSMGRTEEGERLEIRIDPESPNMVFRHVISKTGAQRSTPLGAAEALPWLQLYYLRAFAKEYGSVLERASAALEAARQLCHRLTWWRRG